MQKVLISGVASLVLLAAVTTTSSAGHAAGGLVPGCHPVGVAECGVPLYRNVRYRDEKRVHPCAVPMVVMVQDPCWRDDKCDPCDQPRCVAVQICVPPSSVCSSWLGPPAMNRKITRFALAGKCPSRGAKVRR